MKQGLSTGSGLGALPGRASAAELDSPPFPSLSAAELDSPRFTSLHFAPGEKCASPSVADLRLRHRARPQHALWMMGYANYRVPGTRGDRVVFREDFVKAAVGRGFGKGYVV